MNTNGILCVRFIDDFVVSGESASNAEKAFRKGQNLLSNHGLVCHNPFDKKSNKDKTEKGEVSDGFVFLRYDIRPGLFQPSKKARNSIKKSIDDHIKHGRWSITDVKKSRQ